MKSKLFTLPACWASYLINNDSSGLRTSEIIKIRKFLNDNKLDAPISCSDSGFFSKTNNANNTAGDCLVYTFLI